jgi:hypothetical protein
LESVADPDATRPSTLITAPTLNDKTRRSRSRRNRLLLPFLPFQCSGRAKAKRAGAEDDEHYVYAIALR